MTALAMASATCVVGARTPVAPARRVAGTAGASTTNTTTSIPAHQRAIAPGVAPQQQPRRGALQVRAAGGNPFASDDAAPATAPKAKAAAAAEGNGNPFASILGDKLKDFKMPAMPAMGSGSAAGAYTRPLFSSTSAVLVSEPMCVPFVTSFDPSIY
jgi:hypothetical protein